MEAKVALGWTIIFIDESIFQVKAHITKGIFKVGSSPTIIHLFTREKIFVFGGLSECFFTSCMADKLNHETYLRYVEFLVRKYGKIILVLDGVKYHFEKAKVQKFYQEHEDVLEIIQLPAYSPKLNPIEQVWKKIKRWLGTRIWYTVEELQEQLTSALNNPDFRVKIYNYYMR
ncbi:MAG: transposase [archaeon]